MLPPPSLVWPGGREPLNWSRHASQGFSHPWPCRYQDQRCDELHPWRTVSRQVGAQRPYSIDDWAAVLSLQNTALGPAVFAADCTLSWYRADKDLEFLAFRRATISSGLALSI